MSVLKKTKKTKPTKNTENSVFADDDLLISSIFIFLPLTLRNENVKLHYPPVLSLLLCTVLQNCRNSLIIILIVLFQTWSMAKKP